MKDLLREEDRLLLYEDLVEMFKPLAADRFTIIALTPQNKAFVCTFERKDEPPRDLKLELFQVMRAFVDPKNDDSEPLIL